MRRPKRPGRSLSRLLLFTVSCSLFTLISCSFEITATRYALVYGAADYPGVVNDLDGPDDDAQDMASALAEAGWIVVEMIQPTMDKATIQADIAALMGTVDPDSSVLVYFSGHGAADLSGTTYIIPTDEDPISSTELLSWLDALPCRNRILILDTCYSGGFVTDTGTLDTSPQTYGVYDEGTGGSALLAALGSYSELLASAFQSYDPYTPFVVTAAGSEELSWESSFGGEENGVFTRYFVQAASSGDLDGNGVVTLQEAYRYAAEKVEAVWNSAYFNYYESSTGTYADFLPRISGNARDVVIF